MQVVVIEVLIDFVGSGLLNMVFHIGAKDVVHEFPKNGTVRTTEKIRE